MKILLQIFVQPYIISMEFPLCFNVQTDFINLSALLRKLTALLQIVSLILLHYESNVERLSNTTIQFRISPVNLLILHEPC